MAAEDALDRNLYAVIMAGGKGTRFWPLSRERFPKQYLRLVGDRTLLQDTIVRLDGVVPRANVSVVTAALQREIVHWQAREVLEQVEIVSEPVGRNTAPAIALMAFKLHKRNPGALLLVVPSDHYISDPAAFHEALGRALPFVKKGRIVTFGIKPTRPETGFGYINAGKDRGDGVYDVSRFVEKPDLKTARAYLKDGGYYWNSGMFFFKASAMIGELKAHMPETHKIFSAASRHLNTAREDEALAKAYGAVKEQSIDYGVMERSKRVSMVTASFPWSDIGSWNALEEVMDTDRKGNVRHGNVATIDCEGSIFFTGTKLVAGIGLRDMVVVDTKDATLIAPKSEVQRVKDMVDLLKHEGKDEYLAPMVEERPWGCFSVLEHGPSYKIKNITLKPGQRLSLQMHNHRSEHWIVVSGTAQVTRGEDVFHVHQNESTFIPATVKHRLENPGIIPLMIIEIQSGEYLGEDDILRFDDVYGRNTGK
jgi:mannose-1-phosphate guanylyltransferase/mannose-6-phosphate isomerase